MGLLEIVVLALALAADAFTVGAALGLRFRSARQTFRLAFHFGLFQALLPIVGAGIGTVLLAKIHETDHWVAFGLLSLLGLRMIRTGTSDEPRSIESKDLTRGWSLVGFSLAVSVDALAAGISLPAAGAPVLKSAIIIGVVTGLATLIAIRVAGTIGRRLGTRVEVVAGLVLILLACRILAEHLELF
jgi:manganese efflux pump family protein